LPDPGRRARLRSGLAALAVLALAAAAPIIAGCGGGGSAASAPAVVNNPGSAVPGALRHPRDFALRDQNGHLVRLSGERGRDVVVTFLYTHCPDVCPLIAEHLNRGLLELPPARRARVRVLAVSVDPKGDTHAAVAAFVRRHRLVGEFRYLTGTARQLRPIWKAYDVAAVPDAANDAQIDHSAYELFVDRDGVGRRIYGAEVTGADTRRTLTALGA
jgi:protein SCO1/2